MGVPDLAERADAAGHAALHRATAMLEADGCEVRREVRLGVDPALVRRRGLLLCEAGGYAVHRAAVDADDPGLSEPFKALLRYGAAADPARLHSARRELETGAELVCAAMSGLDALLLPVTPGPPPRLGEDPSDAADLTAWVNACGLPAVALPVASPVNGPVPGLQLVGRPGAERELLSLAARLEARLRPWD